MIGSGSLGVHHHELEWELGAWVGGKAAYLRHRVPSSGVGEEDVVEELMNPLHVLRDSEDGSKGFVEVSLALRV